MVAYHAALAGEVPQVEIGASRTKPGTVNAAVISYLNSAPFHAQAPDTRRTRRNILERWRVENGDKRIAMLQRNHLARMVAAKAGTPSTARNFLNTLRALMKHCIIEGIRADDPTQGIKAPPIKTAGYRTWTEADIKDFRGKHPIGSRARLALELLLCTAQRRSDIVRLGRQHIHDGMLDLRQQEDRHEPDHSRASRTRRGAGSDTERSPDILDYELGQAVFAGRIHELVSRDVQSSGSAARHFCAWAAQGRMSPSGRRRVLRECHSGHQRPCQLARDTEVHCRC
jgi:integrase